MQDQDEVSMITSGLHGGLPRQDSGARGTWEVMPRWQQGSWGRQYVQGRERTMKPGEEEALVLQNSVPEPTAFCATVSLGLTFRKCFLNK